MEIKCPFCESESTSSTSATDAARLATSTAILAAIAVSHADASHRTPALGREDRQGASQPVRTRFGPCHGAPSGSQADTVLRMLVMAGDHCRNVLDEYVRDLRPRFVQADELWTFVHTKERRKAVDDPAEYGDQYIWIALHSETKLLYLAPCRQMGLA